MQDFITRYQMTPTQKRALESLRALFQEKTLSIKVVEDITNPEAAVMMLLDRKKKVVVSMKRRGAKVIKVRGWKRRDPTSDWIADAKVLKAAEAALGV